MWFAKQRRNRTAVIKARADIKSTTSDVDLAWLAGVIDSEGSIALSHGSTRSPHLRVMIYNSNGAILDKCKLILTEASVGWYEHIDARSERPGHALLVGTEGSLRLHTLLRSHLVRQTSQFDAAVAFLTPRYTGRIRVHWTDDERNEWEGLRATYHPRRSH